MEILSSRILVRPADLRRSRRFYRDVLGLAVYREFGPTDDPSVVFFLGQGLLEVSGHAAAPPGGSVMIWLQVRDVRAEHARLAAAGAPIIREPVAEPWGLIEMWIEDPDGIPIVLVEVPAGHPGSREDEDGHGEVVGLVVAGRQLRGDDRQQHRYAGAQPHPRPGPVHHGVERDRGPERKRRVPQPDQVIGHPGEADHQRRGQRL